MTKDQLINLSETEILALTIYGEARGESISGQVAVGQVIRNRKFKLAQSYHEICLAKFQFSCWNNDDPNLAVLLEIGDRLLTGEFVSEIKQQIWISDGIINGMAIDETHGARNYLNVTLWSSSNAPLWSKNMQNTQVIGRHVFGTAA